MTSQPLRPHAALAPFTPLLAIMLLFLALGGCAPRPGALTLAPVPAAADAPRQVTLYVATTRTPEAAHPGCFGSGRSREMHLARYVVSIPPTHKPANIEWPKSGQAPDPAKNFAIVSFTQFTAREFMDELTDSVAEGAAQAPGQDAAPASVPAAEKPALNAEDAATHERRGSQIDMFVHGYNTNFPEALFRMAQLVADNPAKDTHPLLFSWPSDGELSGYVADKDGATFSRDQLAGLLIQLTSDPRVGQVNIGAHSMGCWLTMEALRQLRLARESQTLARLSSVILAAPDIDLDVFQSQVETIGPLDPPLTVLASPDDRALSLSNRLGGDRERVGSLDARDPRISALATAEKIQIIDISSMAGTDSLNHDRFVGAAAALQKVLAPKQNPVRKAGAYVLDAAASVLEVPGRIGRAAADKLQ